MAPNKDLQKIANDSNRRATLKKRGNGLKKKASELATLCDIDACLIVYGEGESSRPEVWPSVPEARRVIERFKSMPELDQCKKMIDLEGLLRERISKLQEQLRKAERGNRERETTLLLHDAIVGRRPGFMGLTVEQLISLGWMAEDRVKKVRDRIAYLRGQQGVQPPLPYATTGADVEALPQQGWLMEVVKAGLDLYPVPYSGFSSGSGSGSGSYGSVGAGENLMQLGNTDVGLAWADPGTSFHDV